MKGQGNKKEKSFEAALQRLEEIVSEMEQGELRLEAMLKKFDEGIRLAQFCSKKLEEAEKKIEVLIKREDGSFETEEFLPSAGTSLDDESPGRSLTPQEETSQEKDEEEEESLF
jgi:exodeoxyribonuclease VII small subunit